MKSGFSSWASWGKVSFVQFRLINYIVSTSSITNVPRQSQALLMRGGQSKLSFLRLPLPFFVSLPSMSEGLPGARHWGHRSKNAMEGHGEAGDRRIQWRVL